MTDPPVRRRRPDRGSRRWVSRLLLLPWAIGAGSCAPLELAPSAPGGNAEAILILPGLGMKREALEPMREFAEAADEAGFDLYLADYRRRPSVERGVDALRRYINEQGLEGYRRVHVFGYILGGFTFNRLQAEHPLENLGNVVFDRSPYQELAPRLATTGLVRIPTWLLYGRVVADLADTPYTPLRRDGFRVGLLIENGTTEFIRRRRDAVFELAGSPCFDPAGFGQPHDAVAHVPFNHDEMYLRLDVVGPELLHFFRHGTFTANAADEPLGIDPFAPPGTP